MSSQHSESVPPNQQTFGHLVGRDGHEAAEEVKKALPDVQVHVVPHNAAVTMDFRMDRVRVFVDSTNKVVREPQRG